MRHMNNCRRWRSRVTTFLSGGKECDAKLQGILTPGAVYLLTTKGPTLKSHSLRKMLNAGPVSNPKLKHVFLFIFPSTCLRASSIHRVKRDGGDKYSHSNLIMCIYVMGKDHKNQCITIKHKMIDIFHKKAREH